MGDTSCTDVSSLAKRAADLDAADPLAAFRERFVIEDHFIYLDGNSLGRLPAATPGRITEAVRGGWAHDLVLGARSRARVGTLAHHGHETR